MLSIEERFKKGDRFGLLTVVSDSYFKDGHRQRRVICDCGQENEVWEHNLATTISCGCAVGEKYEPIFELPENQRKQRHKIIRNGKLLIVEDQTVYRIKGKLLYKCAVNGTSRGYRYDSVSYQEDGKQKHVTVHRLMAEAFIPNPENKPQVNHIDGDPGNNAIENLEWVTAKENVRHAYDTGLIRTLANTPYRCIKCESAVMNEDTLCGDCKSDMHSLKNRLKAKQKQRDQYRGIEVSKLRPRYRKIIRSRFRGDTLEEIGNRFGVTREYIRQLEKQVMDGDPAVYKTKQVKGELSGKPEPEPLLITIKAARINADKKAGNVAKEIGVTTAALYNWEKYKNKIPYQTFIDLCKLYDVPRNNIFGHKDGNWFVPTGAT